MQPLHLVVGSGPTGTACAMALLARGCRVEMVDVGFSLETAARKQLDHLQAVPASLWHGERIRFLKGDVAANVDGIPLKLAYGSDYPYRTSAGTTDVSCHCADTKLSNAKGGLSNVWGSAIMPYRDCDMDGWPATTRDLAAHYEAVAKFLPIAAVKDDLEGLFPSFSANERPMPMSPQAAAVLEDWQKNATELAQAGLIFGRSRLAVDAAGSERAGACTRCGLCLYGCPYKLIWSSADTVDALRSHPSFTYRPGLTVRTVHENAQGVSIEAESAAGQRVTLVGARVYLAAGVLSSTGIMLRSLERVNEPLQMRDSQYFLLPMLRKKGLKGFRRDDLHTLAQLFLEIIDDEVSPFTVHLQAYTYNELYEEPVARMLGPLRAMFPANAFFSRLFLFQGYLHSHHAQPVKLQLEKVAGGDRLMVTGEPSADVDAVLKRVLRKLRRLHRPLGALPLLPLLRRAAPGRGFHSGGVFPMCDRPGRNESDIYGRPDGMRRIHIVDSTVLPSIAATTVTLTAMANAHRIATIAAQLED